MALLQLLSMTTQILTHVNFLANAVENSGVTLGGGTPPEDHVRQVRIHGDLMIGGVFPVHTKGTGSQPCNYSQILETRGIHRVEAMLYALDMVNAQTDFLRGYKLGALILDSCSNPAYALNQSLDFVRDMIDSSNASDYTCSDGRQPQPVAKQNRGNVVAVVGASYSSVTVQIANLLRLFRIVQVSPASTNADLSDKNRFEYFARTVPSDNYQARAMIDIAIHFNWTYVSLVYSADEYGELGANAFKKEARRASICIAIEERVSMKHDSLRESIENLIKKLQPDKMEGARVVALFVGTEYIPVLMQLTADRMLAFSRQANGLAGPRSKKIVWLASEAWDRNNDAYTMGARKMTAEGAIVLMLESQRVPSFEEYYLSLHPGTPYFERNMWLRELWIQKFNCKFDLPKESALNRCEAQRQSKDSFHPDDKIQFVIEAVYAIAHALQALKIRFCPNDSIEKTWIARHAKLPEVCSAMKHIDGEEFYQQLLNVRFRDIVGKRVHFSPQGDGPAHYTILNYRPSLDGQNPEDGGPLASDRSDYVEVGRWSEERLEINEALMFWNAEDYRGVEDPLRGTPILSVCSMPCPLGFRKQLIKEDELCCWACGKCEDYEFLPNETACEDCGPGWWPTDDRKGCFNLVSDQLKHMRWNTWYSIVPTVIASLGILLTLVVIVLYRIYSETSVIKASGRELSYILLLSIILCYLMTFVLLSRPSKFVCAVRRTGVGFAFSSLYAALLVKTNRIHRIFRESTRSAQRPGCISPISQLAITSGLAGVQLLGSVIWLFVVPPGTRHHHPTRAEVVLSCNVPDHHFLYSLTYDAVLIVLCTIYAVKTRKLPENFSEAKYIGFTMYTTCVLWICWILFFFGTGNDFQIQTTGMCISISMSASAALFCIFSTKLYVALFEKQKNTWNQGTMIQRSYRGGGFGLEFNNNNSSLSTPNIHTALLAHAHHSRLIVAKKEGGDETTAAGVTTTTITPRASTSSGMYQGETIL